MGEGERALMVMMLFVMMMMIMMILLLLLLLLYEKGKGEGRRIEVAEYRCRSVGIILRKNVESRGPQSWTIPQHQ